MRQETFTRILVPLDGSSLSAAILPWVASLAGKLGAELHLTSVIQYDDEPFGSLIDRGQVVEFQPHGSHVQAEMRREFEPAMVAVAERPIERVVDRLERIAADLRLAKIGVSTSVASGDPPAEIIKEAHSARCDLIAMATHGRVGIGRGLLGSTTDRVMHASDLPLLIMRPDSGEPGSERAHSRFPTVVLAALDGSELAEACTGPAAAIARRLRVDLRLVRAYEVPGTPAGVDAPLGEMEVVRRRLHEEAQNYLDRQAVAIRDEGLSVAADVVPGPADSALVKAARRWPGSLLVVGSRGRSGLTRWVLGSVTDKVVRSSGRPVLVIPPKLASLRNLN
ncbi:MAG: universal stress protein [Chloroflexi bacterium]|nr:universal stress protein [Chloroflexota bacterium]